MEAASFVTPSIRSPSLHIVHTLKLNSSNPGLLYRAASHREAIAIPTLLPHPCPSGPVVVSTPLVCLISGCPGVLLPHCRKFSISSSGSEGLSNTFCPSADISLTPAKWISEYNNIDACPQESTNRSRFGQTGLAGSYR